ncbi:ABC transporter permease/substrate-binding protein [Bengtsoniella intestinalis]|uniref:ABC transporter permease/substrate-binding protein n=1 Tax=Bengtsoniella intestinalis TaxID=3073143 RepID=UPI00391F7A9C
MTNFANYLLSQWDTILRLLVNHIQYSAIAVFAAILIGVPLGIIIFNSVTARKPVMSIANLVQAIPSLALLGFFVPYLGIGASTAISMVVLYSLLPILKNTYTGLANINPDMIEAAKGIGMTRRQVLLKVQLPLALPVIMAGIRVSAVTSVGLMTIAAYIGADVLGSLVITGIQTDNSYMIFAGAIPACLLALLMDFVVGKIEKAVTPISLQLSASKLTPEAVTRLKATRRFTLGTAGAALALIAVLLIAPLFDTAPDIVVGSKDQTETPLLGNMVADLLDEHTDLKIERKIGLGGTLIAYGALTSGEIDMYPEYTGTLMATVLGDTFVAGTSPEQVYDDIKTKIYEEENLVALSPYPVNNTYALAVTQETAARYNLTTISDLAKVSSNFIIGGTNEFNDRLDGLPGLMDAYDASFKEVKNLTGTLRYTALMSGDVDVTVAFATDSLINKYNLVVLEDDLNFFPPYNIFMLVQEETLLQYPEIEPVINMLLPYITDENMQMLNARVTDDGIDIATVANDFLRENGLID